MTDALIDVDVRTGSRAGTTPAIASLLARHAVLIVVVLAVAASASGILNGFAFDDVQIIQTNARVHSLGGIWHLFGQTYWPPEEGNSLYRPLLMVAFTIQWVIGQGSPLPFHIANVMVYAAACVALYRLLLLMVSRETAFLAAALFAVHPVHVEAVANIVGQAELWVALLIFLATARYIRARRDGRLDLRESATIGALYLTAMMFKEHAVVLPGVLMVADLLLVQNDESLKDRLRAISIAFGLLAAVAIVFVAVRTLVTGDIRAGGFNELFLNHPYATRPLTMLSIVMEWLRLLFWPSDMSADYSYPRTKIATQFAASMVPGTLVIVGAGLIAWHVRRTQPVVTFAVLWIVIAVLIPSNLIVTTGFVLAERTLLLASAGVVLLVSLALVRVWRESGSSRPVARATIGAFVSLILILGIARSSTRAPVWKNNESLFKQTVIDVPSSARAHLRLALQLSESYGPKASIPEVLLAVALGQKDDSQLLATAGDQLARSGMCPVALKYYHPALAMQPLNIQLRVNTSLCLMNVGRVHEARSIAAGGISGNRLDTRLVRMLDLADSLTKARNEYKTAALENRAN